MKSLPLFIFLALLSEILGTVGGFGSSMLFVPMAGYFLDFHSVLGVTALFHVASNLSKIALFRKGFNRKIIATIGIPAILFVIAGAFLTRWLDTFLLQVLLSVFLIAFSLLLLIKKEFRVKPNLVNSITGGALSGFTAGLLGTGGSIRGATLAAFNLDKERFIATSAVIDLGVDLSRSIIYFSNGYVQRNDYSLIPILFVIGLTGTYLGKRLLSKFSEAQFRVIVLMLVIGTSILTLANSLKEVIT